MNGLTHITTVWAIICTDEDGTEGVPLLMDENDRLYPLYTSTERHVPKITTLGRQVALESGCPCVLAKFTTREDTPLPVEEGGS